MTRSWQFSGLLLLVSLQLEWCGLLKNKQTKNAAWFLDDFNLWFHNTLFQVKLLYDLLRVVNRGSSPTINPHLSKKRSFKWNYEYLSDLMNVKVSHACMKPIQVFYLFTFYKKKKKTVENYEKSWVGRQIFLGLVGLRQTNFFFALLVLWYLCRRLH